MAEYDIVETAVLIIGAGAAGLRAAIELAAQDVPCLVVGKRAHGDAHTGLAAGGINAALGSLDEEDDWSVHAADTLREGRFVCQPRAVELMARQAPDRVRELREWGCPFDTLGNGRINQRYFGAQTFRRTCFVGDHTGRAILDTLVHRAGELEVSFRENVFITTLLRSGDAVAGALGWDKVRSTFIVFHCQAIVLAAGGLTGLYHLNTSRTGENTADAIGLALSVGARLRDMEFVQFHPTGMVFPEERRGELVTEAVRGEGGRLFNAKGRRFMERYAPREMELAARDIVARAIDAEIRAGRGIGRNGPGAMSVHLDISHKDRAFLQERLPDMVERFDELGIDLSKDPVEVAPTAHYAMGGVRVDFDTGETDVPGLFAIGEAAAGVHGANRLGGNSLAETLVFGQITGAHLCRNLDKLPRQRLPRRAVADHFEYIAALRDKEGRHDPRRLVDELGKLMWNHAGIVRSAEGIEQGLAALEDLRGHFDDLATYPGDPSSIEWALNLHFMADAAELILRGALMRDESRGAHFREDALSTRETWQESIVYFRDDAGILQLIPEALGPIPEPVAQALARKLRLDYHHLE